MERLSAKKKVTIVRLYLSGLSYDEIAAKSGISKGTVANVVSDLKAGRFPEAADTAEHIELLRELSIDLKRSNLTLGQCATGLTVLTRITECGLDPADIDRWPLILKSVSSEDEARELVRLVYSIEEIQKRTGLCLEELDDKVRELERKTADLEPLAIQRDDCAKQVADLTRQRDNLANTVSGLEQKHEHLNRRVKELEKREKDLSHRTEDMEGMVDRAEATLAALSKEKQELQNIGFSLEAMAQFNDRVQSIAQRHHITAVGLRDRLILELENLDEGLNLESLIQSRQVELQEKEQAVVLAGKEQESLKTAIASLKKEKTKLEASIKNTRGKVSNEIAKMIPAARDMVNQLSVELRCGHDEALVEIQRLRDEALEVGKEIGRYEEILRNNQWLTDLLALVRTEENVEGKRVKVIVLLVLRAVAAWLKRNESNGFGFPSLKRYTGNLIRELEQWKA